jgi:preprotein translocase subunit Sec61beta
MSKRLTKPSGSVHGGHSGWNTAKTIAWSFFGVRRRQDHEQEGLRISPIHVLVAGFVGVFVLVAGLIVLVNWVAA